MKLMVPGPAETYADGLVEMARPLLPHYGEEFLEVWHSVLKDLKTVMGTQSEIIMLPGAGTAGTEMALCGFAGKKCIVLRAGTFSDRLAEILAAHRAHVVDVMVPDRQCAMAEMVRDALKAHPDAAAVCMVHSETSTGVIHPAAEVGRAVKDSDAIFVLDAVSSVGALEFQMDAWGVDVCWTASQKALGCPPGLAFVAFSPRALAFLEGNAKNITSWYLNPLVWKWHADNWAWHPYPTSLPTPVFVAARAILEKMVAHGLARHYEKQARAAAAIRNGCKAIGFQLYAADEAFASPTVTAIIPPKGLDEAAFREAVLRDHDIMIAGGFGKLRGQIIRVGHMGPGTDMSYVLATLHAMEASARKIGVSYLAGSALRRDGGKYGRR